MLYNKIILAGGTGFVGQYLQSYFAPKTQQVIVLCRKEIPAKGNIQYLRWDGQSIGPWAAALEGADMLINLTGKSVNCRYTPKNKQAIFDSRTDSTKVLGEAVKQLASPPLVWFNASSATIYRHAEDRPHTEENGEYHNDFSVQVCKKWEQAFDAIALPQTRKVVLRMAIVLGQKDGVVKRFQKLTQAGLGGPQGSGRQYFSWIHEKDLARLLEFIYAHPNLSGVFNCAAPAPVKNEVLMQTFQQLLHPPFALGSPVWLLRLGAVLIGTETELLLKSRWVLPARLTQEGFEFEYPDLRLALQACLSQ
jgi:uncharacterized protein (TIGR01777 family)